MQGFHIVRQLNDDHLVFVYHGSVVVVNVSSGQIVCSLNPPSECKTEEDKAKQSKTEAITCIATHCPSSMLVVCYDSKVLRVVRMTADGLQVIGHRQTPKRISAALFDAEGLNLFVADKFGDVYRMAVDHSKKLAVELLVGHVSLITDIALVKHSAGAMFLLSSDRDEKIRVTKYPECYDIQGFCLGHEQFVSRIQLLPNDILLSGGGDGYLLAWDYRSGALLQKLPLLDIDETKPLCVSCLQFCSNSNTVAVVLENRNNVMLLDASQEKLEWKPSLLTDRPPIDICFDKLTGNLYCSLPSTQSGDALVGVWTPNNGVYDPQGLSFNHTSVSSISMYGPPESSANIDLFQMHKLRKFDFIQKDRSEESKGIKRKATVEIEE